MLHERLVDGVGKREKQTHQKFALFFWTRKKIEWDMIKKRMKFLSEEVLNGVMGAMRAHCSISPCTKSSFL